MYDFSVDNIEEIHESMRRNHERQLKRFRDGSRNKIWNRVVLPDKRRRQKLIPDEMAEDLSISE